MGIELSLRFRRTGVLPIGEYVDNGRDQQNLGTRAIQGGGITIISRVFGQVAQLGGTMVLARILTPNDFGVVAMVTSIVGLLLLFSDLGLTDATLQAENITNSQASNLFWIILAFNALVSLLMVVVAPAIAAFFRNENVRLISIALSVQVVLFGLGNQHFALLRREMKFLGVSIATLSASVIGNVVAILMAWRGFGFWSLVAREIATALIRAISAWLMCRWRPSLPRLNSNTRGLMRFGVATSGSLGVAYLADNLDKALVGKVFGANDLGYYARSFGVFTLPLGQFTTSLHHVAVSTLSRLRESPEEFKRYYLRAISAVSFLGMPLAGFMVAASREITFVFFGPQWSRSAELLAILGCTAGIKLISMTSEWLNASLGRADRRLKWQLVSFSVTMTAIGIGLLFGLRGVAIAYSIATAFLVIPALLYAGKPVKLRFCSIIRSFWQSTVSAACAAAACWRVFALVGGEWNVVGRLFVIMISYMLAYIGATIVLNWGLKPVKEILSLFWVLVGKKKH
jgi:PST family polysaccharide transporter